MQICFILLFYSCNASYLEYLANDQLFGVSLMRLCFQVKKRSSLSSLVSTIKVELMDFSVKKTFLQGQSKQSSQFDARLEADFGADLCIGGLTYSRTRFSFFLKIR